MAQRGESYGLPHTPFENVAKRWSLTLSAEVTAQQVVICLIELKLARLNSNSKHHDSIVDVAGYAGILNEINNKEGGVYGA
ncbi:MAG: hypothetical protein HRT36_08200 [Alphaproteobacteria bacterium]|nr:hypothetical protein [Alphaproteobacteria bacterium]